MGFAPTVKLISQVTNAGWTAGYLNAFKPWVFESADTFFCPAVWTGDGGVSWEGLPARFSALTTTAGYAQPHNWITSVFRDDAEAGADTDIYVCVSGAKSDRFAKPKPAIHRTSGYPYSSFTEVVDIEDTCGGSLSSGDEIDVLHFWKDSSGYAYFVIIYDAGTVDAEYQLWDNTGGSYAKSATLDLSAEGFDSTSRTCYDGTAFKREWSFDVGGGEFVLSTGEDFCSLEYDDDNTVVANAGCHISHACGQLGGIQGDVNSLTTLWGYDTNAGDLLVSNDLGVNWARSGSTGYNHVPIRGQAVAGSPEEIYTFDAGAWGVTDTVFEVNHDAGGGAPYSWETIARQVLAGSIEDTSLFATFSPPEVGGWYNDDTDVLIVVALFDTASILVWVYKDFGYATDVECTMAINELPRCRIKTTDSIIRGVSNNLDVTIADHNGTTRFVGKVGRCDNRTAHIECNAAEMGRRTCGLETEQDLDEWITDILGEYDDVSTGTLKSDSQDYALDLRAATGVQALTFVSLLGYDSGANHVPTAWSYDPSDDTVDTFEATASGGIGDSGQDCVFGTDTFEFTDINWIDWNRTNGVLVYGAHDTGGQLRGSTGSAPYASFRYPQALDQTTCDDLATSIGELILAESENRLIATVRVPNAAWVRPGYTVTLGSGIHDIASEQYLVIKTVHNLSTREATWTLAKRPLFNQSYQTIDTVQVDEPGSDSSGGSKITQRSLAEIRAQQPWGIWELDNNVTVNDATYKSMDDWVAAFTGSDPWSMINSKTNVYPPLPGVYRGIFTCVWRHDDDHTRYNAYIVTNATIGYTRVIDEGYTGTYAGGAYNLTQTVVGLVYIDTPGTHYIGARAFLNTADASGTVTTTSKFQVTRIL